MSNSFLTWQDRADFEIGALYVTANTDTKLEYIGTVSAGFARRLVLIPEDILATDGNEPVMLFGEVGDAADENENDRMIDAKGRLRSSIPWLWIHTRLQSEQGQVFVPFAQRLRDEIDVDEEGEQ